LPKWGSPRDSGDLLQKINIARPNRGHGVHVRLCEFALPKMEEIRLVDRITPVTPIKNRPRSGSAIEVLLAFAKLGVSCFGGPIAHIGYFRQEFVVRRGWLDEQAYADLVALCQFLPGPASSQVGFSLGLMRAGYLGGLAAWLAFTLPSAVALVLFAYGANALEGEIGSGLLHGLTGGRGNCRPSRVGHGAHALSRSGTGFDRRHRRIDHPVDLGLDRSDRRDCLGRYGRPLALSYPSNHAVPAG
jgi:hypothetical protein